MLDQWSLALITGRAKTFGAATDVLKAAARKQGTSLNRYVTALLHEQAQREHHRMLFAEIAARKPDTPPVDSVAEVRAMRDEQDATDAEQRRGTNS